jgi:hypothetical protein
MPPVASARNLSPEGFILTENKPAMNAFKFVVKNPLCMLLTVVFLFLCFPLLAQDVDHVYLKSGSIVRGRILEIAPEDQVKIEDLGGNLWVFPMTEVEKISAEPYEMGKDLRPGPPGFGAGFVNMTSLGFLAGSAQNEQVAPFSLLTVNGYRTPAGLFAGIGTGVEFFSTNYMPFFLDLRFDLFGEDVVPYLIGKGGYSLPLSANSESYDVEYDYSGGPLLGVGVGLKVRTRTHFAWDVSLMYRYQETSYKETYGWNTQDYEYSDIYNRIEIRLGLYID